MSIDLGSEWIKIAIVKPGVPMEIVLNKYVLSLCDTYRLRIKLLLHFSRCPSLPFASHVCINNAYKFLIGCRWFCFEKFFKTQS